MIVYKDCFQFCDMNQPIDTPNLPALRYRRSQPAKEQRPFQEEEASAQRSSVKRKTTGLQRLVTFPSLALTTVMAFTVFLSFQVTGIIETEGLKALLIIQLLCLLKHLSQPFKQV